MTDQVHISRFTPSRMKAEDLEAIFVQRHKLADDTVERIRESALTGDKHHILLIGPRGSGKTHFVSLIYHRINGDAELEGKLRIAWLNEDETSTSFLDVLLRIWRALQQKYPDEFEREAMQLLYDLDPAQAEKHLSRLLLESLASHTLLVIVENLDDVFNGIDEEGQQKLRSLIQENPVFTILASSQQLFEDVTKRTSPFFGFFQTEHLKQLSLDDAVELLSKIANLNGDKDLAAFLATPAGRARVRALHHLSGGNPRIYITLSQFVDRDKLDELVTPFEKMLDELTPYYQHRVDRLAPQQRKIVEFLCTRQRPVPVKEIARKLFATNQTISTQLKSLREMRYVESHQRGRESLYELTEPLMRMSYEVKENRRGPIRLIIDFLRIWYERDELATRLADLPLNSLLSREYVSAALDEYEKDGLDLRVRTLLDELQAAESDQRYKDALEISRDLATLRGTVWDWLMVGNMCEHLSKHEEGLAAVEKAIELEPSNARAWGMRGFILKEMQDYAAAIDSLDKALELQPDYVAAIHNRGIVFEHQSQFVEALIEFELAIEIDPTAWYLWANKANVLFSLRRYEESLNAYGHSLNLESSEAITWIGRGNALRSLRRFDEALESFDKAIELNPSSASAWDNKALTFVDCDRYEDSIVAVDKALEISPKDAEVWNFRGAICAKLKRFDEALQSFDQAIELNPDAVHVWLNRSETLAYAGEWKLAFEQLERAFAEFSGVQISDVVDAESLTKLILWSTLNESTWRERVERLVAIFSTKNLITVLGSGLLEGLSALNNDILSRNAIRAWRDIWFEAGKNHPELTVALRMFDVGIRCLQSDDPQKTLLDLNIEERRIVAEALGIESE